METGERQALEIHDQGQSTTYYTAQSAAAHFEFLDRFGAIVRDPASAVLARHRSTGHEVPIRTVWVHRNYRIADLGDRLIVGFPAVDEAVPHP